MKLVHGIGINDSDYTVQICEVIGYNEDGKRISKQVWICPYYLRWKSMLTRCYGKLYQTKQPSYIGCSVHTDWHRFSNFRAWMETQDWEGKQLDKDILIPGNTVYDPSSCVFVTAEVNSFINERNNTSCKNPVGTYFRESKGTFEPKCWSVETKKRVSLGSYDNAEEAHQAWLNFKLSQAKILASQQTDERVAKALIERYENYDRH